MNNFIKIRDTIRRFVLAREMFFLKVWNALITFAGLICINVNFGYQKAISHIWIAVIIALVGAFLPIAGVSFVLVTVLVIDLFALSPQIALFAVCFVLVGYVVCAYFHSKNAFNLVTVPLCFGYHCPYAMSLGSGLMCNLNEITSVICGSVFAYFLHVVKSNSSAILDETSDVSAFSLVSVEMFQNKMFYFFVIAMAAMFLVVYLLRSADIRMSWLIAVIAGAVVEFIIMMSGYLLTGASDEIPDLIFGTGIAVLVGVILNYFIMDLDYSRIEKVQFEDDDYYYYVTAVPKIRIVEEEKEVKTFK